MWREFELDCLVVFLTVQIVFKCAFVTLADIAYLLKS